ncbi:InlB B-repeat-containing protein [Butyrivibrio sp. INlla16]|uniref:InlB B-repeat-containing protein n=1 Tax=Butyrivibrio sp. INlla16 TaxID=1520807 RepID=UPI000885240F|nr:InlB B-repeat-containing protein [Butyrivibrio sp. INlla16]SDB52971.1 Ig-like domain (group 2) [Butyrivibrio sp. INlla16]
MKKMLRSKRITATIIIAALLVMFGKGNSYTKTVHAESEKTISGLGTGAISNPTPGAGGWSYVYYGTYDGSAMKYRVLDKAATQFNTNTTMLLDCDSTIINKRFDDDSNEWEGSEIKGWLNGNDFYGNTDVFTAQENAAITRSTKGAASSGDGIGFQDLDYAPLAGEHIFLLDAVEATRPSYGYANKESSDDTRKKSGTGTWWFLRSPNSRNPYFVGDVYESGTIDDYYVYYDDSVSPAFNLNLSSVIFSSVISGTAGSAGAEYKLTIADDELNITPGTVTRAGTTITVPYTLTGTSAGDATRVSVLIMDSEYSAGTAVTSGYTYLKLSGGTSGSGTFTLPDAYADKICGTDYYAYILAEDENTGNATDFASAPTSIVVPDPTYCTITFDANGGTVTSTSGTTGADGKLTSLPTPDYARHVFKGWRTEASGGTQVTTDTVFTSNETIYAQWDEIPVVSYEVIFKVINGSWNDGTTADKKVTLSGYKGDVLKLAESQIPEVGNKPGNNYQEGSWDTEPIPEMIVNEDKTFTYTYKAKEEEAPKIEVEAPVKEPTENVVARIFFSGIKVVQKNGNFRISWDKTEGVSKYEVYMTYCGSQYAKKPVVTTTNNKVTIKKLKGKKLNLKKNIKIYVAAYDGSGNSVGKTVSSHVAGKDSKKYTNPKEIKLTTKALTLSKGETVAVKATLKYESKEKKQVGDGHAAKLRYASTDPGVATVDKNGTVTAVDSGNCTIYVYSVNGLAKRVSVTVN